MKNAGGPVDLGELLDHLRARGYHVHHTRLILDQFVDVGADGRVHRKRGGSA